MAPRPFSLPRVATVVTYLMHRNFPLKMDVVRRSSSLVWIHLPFSWCPWPGYPGPCRVSQFEKHRGDLSRPAALFIYIISSSFNLPPPPPPPAFSPPFSRCHLCLCVCHSSPHLTGWHQSPVLFLLLKLRLTLHSGGGACSAWHVTTDEQREPEYTWYFKPEAKPGQGSDGRKKERKKKRKAKAQTKWSQEWAAVDLSGGHISSALLFSACLTVSNSCSSCNLFHAIFILSFALCNANVSFG